MGIVVALIVVVAIATFRGAEALESRFGGVSPTTGSRAKRPAAITLLVAASVLVVHGQPTPEQKWARTSPATRQRVEARAIFASPAEVVSLRKDTSLEVSILDLRDEHDFNLFHVGGARRVAAPPARDPALLRRLLARPAHVVTFLIGNGEERAREAWEELTALGVTNLYVVEGGVSRWLSRYPLPACVATASPATGAEGLGARFTFAVGDRTAASWPELPITDGRRAPCEPTADETDRMSHARGHAARWPEHPFTKRVQLQTKSVVKGGCG
jgi:rhodanese-related sulfurtransferase